MPSITKTLILNVAPLDQNLKTSQGTAAPRRKKLRNFVLQPSARKLKIVIWLLDRMGYEFSTVSQALANPGGRKACLVLESAAHAPATSKAIATLTTANIPATLFVATGAITDFGPLAALARNGFEIGFLGHEAIDLTTRGYLEQRQNIAKARSAAAIHLPRAPRVFAYPFGAYDATTLTCLKEEGFQAALSAHTGANGPNADRFQLRQMRFTTNFFADLWSLFRLSHSPSSAALPAGVRTATDRDEVRGGAAL